ncbi:MAG: hypothetical protein JSV03_06235, partial [Planctomycetota bacterium]
MAANSESVGVPAEGGMRFGTKLLLALVLLSLISVVLIWMFLPPKYKARSAVYVESPYPKWPLQLDAPPAPLEVMDRFVASQAVLLKDDKILTGTLQAAPVLETMWYRTEPDKDELLIELQDDLFVRQVPNANYLAVSFATKDRRDAPV